MQFRQIFSVINEQFSMKSYRLTIIRNLSTAFLLWGLLFTPLMGQSLFVERAMTTVAIQQDNLVRAKAEALKDAKGQVILQAAARFLDFDSTISLKHLLIKHFFEHPDIYIESIRVISEGNTPDLTEFTLNIETRIFHSRLLAAFRKLGLPTKHERIPFRDVLLIYDADRALRQKRALNLFFEQLQARLKPYRIRAKVILTGNRNLPIEAGLPARLALLPRKTTEKSDGTALALVELKLRLTPQPEISPQGKLEAQLIFWSQEEDFSEPSKITTRATADLSYKDWRTEKVIPAILDGLLLQWTPVMQKILAVNQGSGAQVKLKFKGLPGPIEEQRLIKTFFLNNPRWKRLSLDTISSNFVSYKALYLGKQENILREFSSPKDKTFRILSVNWEDNYLVVHVEWNEVPALLEPFYATLEEKGLFEGDSEEKNVLVPELQVPLRTFKQTYSLPLARIVYDNIRHRGDSTLFRIKVPKEPYTEEVNKVVSLTWRRLGPTHLRPKLTLFDQNRKRIKSHLLRSRKQFSFKYKIPFGKETFYLRISDEVGFLKGVTGSFQSFQYVLTAN